MCLERLSNAAMLQRHQVNNCCCSVANSTGEAAVPWRRARFSVSVALEWLGAAHPTRYLYQSLTEAFDHHHMMKTISAVACSMLSHVY
jgi:hypothetical protein